jgi:hypothetical protein
MPDLDLRHPRAIAMWDISWLLRRWPGAGFEDWDRALDELVERGYDAVRLEAFPHLLSVDPNAEWEFLPGADCHDWGSPLPVRARPWPALGDFIRRCRDRGVVVGLSTWFPQDATEARLRLASPQDHAAAWARILDLLDSERLLDALLYVDLCNEWPHPNWAPFFKEQPRGALYDDWSTEPAMAWMRAAIAALRPYSRGLPLTFSVLPNKRWARRDLEFLDFLEPHIWMAQASDFYERFNYDYPTQGLRGYRMLQQHAEPLYRAERDHWRAELVRLIRETADLSAELDRPVATTECWALVEWRDLPGLDWALIKELCDLGVRTAAETGRWAAIATSNFCEPQFVGMWRDVDWHRELTSLIKGSGKSS